jgi:xanthine/uracil/vitamin C permease (AzgA family)
VLAGRLRGAMHCGPLLASTGWLESSGGRGRAAGAEPGGSGAQGQCSRHPCTGAAGAATQLMLGAGCLHRGRAGAAPVGQKVGMKLAAVPAVSRVAWEGAAREQHALTVNSLLSGCLWGAGRPAG